MLKQYKGIVNERVFLFNQPQMAQVLIGPLTTVAEGNAFTLTVNDRVIAFEFDNDASVTPGRVGIAFGTVAQTAHNMQAEIERVFGDLLRFVVEDSYLVVISNNRATDFTGTSLSGVGVTNLMPQRSTRPMAAAFLNRPVKAVDVTRGVISIYTAIDNIIFFFPLFRTTATNDGIVGWNGEWAVDGEQLQLFQGTGGGTFAAGHLLQVIVVGDKSEDS